MMIRQTFSLAALGAMALVSSLGCIVGPGSIAAGRSVYNNVINSTENDQLLNMIVRDRYGETYGMLTVASVTANIHARADVSTQFGLSRSLREDYSGNLIPLAGGVAFEENPTISYVPLAGEVFVPRLISPLSTEEAMQMSQFLPDRRDIYMAIALRSINGIRNPMATLEGEGSETFARVVHLWQFLRGVGVMQIVSDPSGEFEVIFELDGREYEKELEELLALTKISKRPSGGRLSLPMRVAAVGQTGEAFNLKTRSVLEILRTAGGSIEIPESHLKAGVVEPWIDKHEGRFMRIRTSRVRPSGAGTVAINYRGWWYYVDDADPASKSAFLLLRMLVGLRLHQAGLEQAAPALTIPVGR